MSAREVQRYQGHGVPGVSEQATLANGLRVVVHRTPQAPVVSTLVLYRAGTRDEQHGQGGSAHFLEHMMFKGSGRFGPGEVDRLTQSLGGNNNAFTTHDATAYYFQFAKEHWRTALEIERDRMVGLELSEREVESERRVILEEIALYDNDPWAALDLLVQRTLFQASPYGLPVLGTADELERTTAGDLRGFHGRHYGPDRATVVVGGDVGDEVLAGVELVFGDLAPRSAPRGGEASTTFPAALLRVAREQGSVARFQLALPAVPADHPDHPALRLALTTLVAGRASRLQRILVDENQWCLYVSGDLREYQSTGSVVIAGELLPGAPPAQIEGAVLGELECRRDQGVSADELERARCLVRADWLFGHERVHQQTLQLGYAATFTDLSFPGRYLERIGTVSAQEVQRAARRYLDPGRGGVIGWSHPSARPDAGA